MGSFGDMNRARLLPEQDYAAGIGLVFPIWNGGEDAKREAGYKMQADYQRENLKNARLEYAREVQNVRDEFNRNREALVTLEKNLQQVEKTIRIASQRYQRLEGPLIDVREAFKQLREMDLQRSTILNILASTSLEMRGMLHANQ